MCGRGDKFEPLTEFVLSKVATMYNCRLVDNDPPDPPLEDVISKTLKEICSLIQDMDKKQVASIMYKHSNYYFAASSGH